MNTLFDQVQHLRLVLDSIPSIIFICDENLKILDANKTAKMYLDKDEDAVLQRLCGEAFHCIHQQEIGDTCGQTSYCNDCILRKAVRSVVETSATFHDKHALTTRHNGKEKTANFTITASPLYLNDAPLVLMVLQDITELTVLRRFITLCATCKKTRNDTGEWEEIHYYLRRNENITCSHGLCPSCYIKHCDELEKL